MYDRAQKYRWDNKNVMDFAVKEAIEQGLEQGILQGILQGVVKGEHQKAVDIARELKKEGLSAEFIAKTTKLSIEEIEKLKPSPGLK